MEGPIKTDCTGCRFCQRQEYSAKAAPETHYYRCAFFDDWVMPIMFRAVFNPERQLTKSARQIEGPWSEGSGEWTRCPHREAAP